MRTSSSPCTGRGRSGRPSGTTCWPSRISPNAVRTRRPTSRTRWPRSRPRPSSCWAARLGDYDDPRSDSRHGVPQDGEITFLPEIPGVQFNPERGCSAGRRTCIAKSSGCGPSPDLAGRVARGRLTVYLGVIILAEVDLALRVDVAAPSPQAPQPPPQPEHARPYRKIFASYSHRDVEVVRQFELLAASLGDEYLRDIARLHSGADWDEALLRLIDEADVFQLFWSSNSMLSPYVRREWEYAISLARPYFIRPTYWEDPLPTSQQPALPPDSLRRLHFSRIAAAPEVPAASPGPMPIQAAAPPAPRAPHDRRAAQAQPDPGHPRPAGHHGDRGHGLRRGHVVQPRLSEMPRSNRRLPCRRRRRPEPRARPHPVPATPRAPRWWSNISRRRSSTAATTTRYRMTHRSPRVWSAPFAATQPGQTPRPMSGTSSTPTSRPCPRPSPT